MNFENPRKNYTGIAFITAAHLLAAFIAVKNSTVWISHGEPPEVTVMPRTERRDPPPPPPDKKFEPELRDAPIILPKLDFDIVPDKPTVTARREEDVRDEPRNTGGGGGGRGTASGNGEVAQHVPVRVAPVIDANNCAKPAYPAAALRNEETGTVALAFLVGKDGKVASARVERSSGSRDLDRAAVNGLSLCRFAPGTVDGAPYESWFRMQYVWSLD